jgi:hypothetical protein
MNVNQQAAFAKLHAAAHAIGHSVGYRRFPSYHQLRCSCGWSRQVPRQNALAAAAKLTRHEREHYLEALKALEALVPAPKPAEPG